MKVAVERELCSGHGQCNVMGPDVYQLDDDGYVFVEDSTVAPHLESQARQGAAACPELALTCVE